MLLMECGYIENLSIENIDVLHMLMHYESEQLNLLALFEDEDGQQFGEILMNEISSPLANMIQISMNQIS